MIVGAIGLPVVLGLVYLGGWWLFVLTAVAGVFALHEFSRLRVLVRQLLHALARAPLVVVADLVVLRQLLDVV
ncbi:MAG TPA: hypothetical protein VE736_03630, partial [Gaiellaceae bacterium]|nr:hypothetical protein [Gaiellaceae bacterium]